MFGKQLLSGLLMLIGKNESCGDSVLVGVPPMKPWVQSHEVCWLLNPKRSKRSKWCPRFADSATVQSYTLPLVRRLCALIDGAAAIVEHLQL